ncbi:MAG: NADPH-dependent FMN reductase [Candidatus Nanohaloarchaea archaeon]
MDFLVVEGTVREGRKSIHAARHVTSILDEEHDAELFDLKQRDVPMMEHTRYGDSGEVPEDVEEYGRKVEEADCVVLVTPEYNHSITGALKNLFDYLYPEYEDKPFASVTVSGGGFGGVRAQMHLENILIEVGSIVGPSLAVSNVGDVFSSDGDIIDENYRGRFEKFCEQVLEHAERY